MSGPTVVLDANALIPIRLASTLLWLAEAGLFQPPWSDRILGEVEHNRPKLGVDPKHAARRVGFMREAFGAEALVDGFDELIEKMTCDPKDAHVLAAAVHDEADALVTFNLKDFPAESTDPHGVEVLHPDAFLFQLLNRRPTAVIAALEVGVQDLRRPPETMSGWLAGLAATVPMFANLAADAMGEPPDPVSPVVAMTVSDDDSVAASLGEPGDLTSPAQVALLWYAGLLDDLDIARSLTYDPSVWDDYGWAVEHLEKKSLASKVIPAVDAPDRIAFMRFVPEVAQTSQVFQSFLAPVTFLTVVRIEDGTWRVWGLGPALLPAREILGE
ncbi:PIN domain-containing protein [Brevibacterium sp.]|uniref:PIN domain-containing protein n=1 Tax=Brevibacterium sp. TaxID=1701 RepID=UPI0025BEE92C|nr:PIN domain-containing protein [Brevibacterium sp.]